MPPDFGGVGEAVDEEEGCFGCGRGGTVVVVCMAGAGGELFVFLRRGGHFDG